MLNYIFFKQRVINYIKNNFFLDFGLKLLTKIFVYNILIHLSFFFAEKFLIEYFTRYIFNYSAIKLNKIALILNIRYIIIYMVLFSINIISFLF